jgi:hypothetical protein
MEAQMNNKIINITAFLLSMLWAAMTEFQLKKQELNKYLEEVISYWDKKCKEKEQQLTYYLEQHVFYHERPQIMEQRIKREITRIKREAKIEIANTHQYVERELKAAEKRFLKKDMAAERLAEKQMKAAKAKKKINRQSAEEEIDLGVFGEHLDVNPNDARIQRHHQTISHTEYDRIEKRKSFAKRRRDAQTNKFAMYKLGDKTRKTERENSRTLKYSSFV